MIYYGCPNCQAPMASPEGMAGQNETCPQCGNVARVPAPTPPATPPVAVQAPQQPAKTVVRVAAPKPKGSSGFGIAALVLGILACLTCWIPFLGVLSIPVAALGLLFAALGFVISALGRQSSIGMPVAGGVICGVALFIAIGMTAAVTETMDRIAEDLKQEPTGSVTPTATTSLGQPRPAGPARPAGAAKKAPARSDEPIKLGTAYALNNRTLKVLSVRVGKVSLKDVMDGDTESEKEFLMVDVEISNTSTDKKFTYSTLRGGDFSSLLGLDFASLSDSKKNVYKRVGFGFTTQIANAVKDSTSLYPGKSVRDILVFEPPVKGTGPYRLELPLGNLGGKGLVICEIPESALKQSAS